ncbi:MAG: hypothetical protein HYS25_01090 [Ignavibacteriales bacterium]|nr:hypothetical protein [Ignavibacteriales bacterium]
MSHYDDIQNEMTNTEIKELKNELRLAINIMSNDEVRFIARVINKLDEYKRFFELLKEFSAHGS